MKYLLPFITAGVGLIVGLLLRRKKVDTGTVPISVVDVMRLYEQVRRDIVDSVEREATIEKLKKRLGL